MSDSSLLLLHDRGAVEWSGEPLDPASGIHPASASAAFGQSGGASVARSEAPAGHPGAEPRRARTAHWAVLLMVGWFTFAAAVALARGYWETLE